MGEWVILTVLLFVIVGRRRVVLSDAVRHGVAGASGVIRHTSHTHPRGSLTYNTYEHTLESMLIARIQNISLANQRMYL